MAILKNGAIIFIGDIIEFGNSGIGKIKRFVLKAIVTILVQIALTNLIPNSTKSFK